MANKESTAVNELINMAQAGYDRVRSDEDDLMFRPPSPPPARPVSTPTIRGAISPMPRAPSGTSTMPAIPQLPTAGPVRVTTAPANRTASIPPLPQPPANFRSTHHAVPPPPHQRRSATAAAAEGTPAPELFTRNGAATTLPGPTMTRPPAPPVMPVAAPFEMRLEEPAPAPPAPMTLDGSPEPVESSWFQSSRMVEKVDESWSSTSAVKKLVAPPPRNWTKLVVPAAGAALIAFFAIGYVAFDGEGPNRTAAAAKVETKPAPIDTNKMTAKRQPVVAEAKAAPAPVPAADPAATDTTKQTPPVEPPKAEPPKAEEPKAAEPAKPAVATTEPAKPETAPVPTPVAANLVDVRFDSSPAGATVMLVDRGKSNFLGTTPVSASIDPSRKYDVVFTLDNHPTVLQHLDPKATHHLAVALGKTPAAPMVAKTEPPKVEAPKAETPKVETPKVETPKVAKVEPKKVEPKAEAPKAEPKVAKEPAPKTETKAEPKVAKEPAPASGDMGTLMVSSKPPCQIVIDGHATGLTTPQRAIPLPPGTHKVTFVNAAENINKTVTVNVTAGTPTKLIQNLMQ